MPNSCGAVGRRRRRFVIRDRASNNKITRLDGIRLKGRKATARRQPRTARSMAPGDTGATNLTDNLLTKSNAPRPWRVAKSPLSPAVRVDRRAVRGERRVIWSVSS